jgi:ATP-binding cassette subfamily B protein
VKELYFMLETPAEFEQKLSNHMLELTDDSLKVKVECWRKDLNFHIRRGSWTVFVGETGCGKSHTLARIATGLILSGKKISMVQQEPYLFNDTIAGNIFLGRERTPEENQAAKELLTIFQLESLAPSLDEVLELEVGENGKRLSGGQMKRVALIRSLLSGSDILIWDDPFSSVDIILERRIVRLIRENPKWKNHTFIISSHRLTTVRLSDELIFLDKEAGIKTQGEVSETLKDANVAQFFKEQHLEASLA